MKNYLIYSVYLCIVYGLARPNYIGQYRHYNPCQIIKLKNKTNPLISWGTPYLETTPNVLSHVFGHGLTCSNLTLEIGQSQT